MEIGNAHLQFMFHCDRKLCAVKPVLKGHCYVRTPLMYGHVQASLFAFVPMLMTPPMGRHLPFMDSMMGFLRCPFKTGSTVCTFRICFNEVLLCFRFNVKTTYTSTQIVDAHLCYVSLSFLQFVCIPFRICIHKEESLVFVHVSQ